MKKALLLALVLLAGCVTTPTTEKKCSGPTVSLASFNIQSFGAAKARNATTMAMLADIITRFDLVAIQEIRDINSTALSLLANMTNYSYVVSPRLGTSNYKEQYAFLYNDKIVFENVSYVFNSTVFERPPFVAKFSAGEFDFFAVNVHVKPELGRTRKEIMAMKELVETGEDYIMLGDFNADCNYLDEEMDELLPGFFVAVPGTEDTTVGRSDCAYDRVVFTETALEDFHSYGVHKFDEGMSMDEAKRVSDHYPVYAEFYTVCDSD